MHTGTLKVKRKSIDESGTQLADGANLWEGGSRRKWGGEYGRWQRSLTFRFSFSKHMGGLHSTAPLNLDMDLPMSRSDIHHFLMETFKSECVRSLHDSFPAWWIPKVSCWGHSITKWWSIHLSGLLSDCNEHSSLQSIPTGCREWPWLRKATAIWGLFVTAVQPSLSWLIQGDLITLKSFCFSQI